MNKKSEIDVSKELIHELFKCSLKVTDLGSSFTLCDVLHRCNCWLESGGDFKDDYILRQIEYLKRINSLT